MSDWKQQISTLLRPSSSAQQTSQLLSVPGDAYANLDQAVASTAGQLAELQSAVQAQLNSIATTPSTSSSSSNGGSSAGDVFGNIAEPVLGGFTLSPIVRGLMSLFGGGDDSAPAPLAKYVPPSSVSISGGLTSDASGPVAVDYGQSGQSRAVTVNIQAMDSQSFLDRSDDIARAVKRAMLESSSLNDVVSEL
jgi:hypothetical protein